MDNGTEKIINGISKWAETIAEWAKAFTTWFLDYLGSNAVLLIPIVLMFIVLGIETIRRLIHGY